MQVFPTSYIPSAVERDIAFLNRIVLLKSPNDHQPSLAVKKETRPVQLPAPQHTSIVCSSENNLLNCFYFLGPRTTLSQDVQT